MSQNKNYYSKRNNRLTKKEFNKKNNIRSNSYSSRYINMYLTKEMDITPKHKKNISNNKYDYKQIEDDYYNISRIKNTEICRYNDSSPNNNEHQDIVNIFKTDNTKLKKDNNDIKKEQILFFEKKGDNNFIISTKEKEGNKKNQISQKIIAKYSFLNKTWILIQEIFGNSIINLFWTEVNENILKQYKLRLKNKEIKDLNENDINIVFKDDYKEKYENQIKKYNALNIQMNEVNQKFEYLKTKFNQVDNQMKERDTLINILNEEKIDLLKKISDKNNNELTSIINSLQKENDILKNKNSVLKNKIKKIPYLIELEIKKYTEQEKNKFHTEKNFNKITKDLKLNLDNRKINNKIIKEENFQINCKSSAQNSLSINYKDEIQNLEEILNIKDKKIKVIYKNLKLINESLKQSGYYDNPKNTKFQNLINQTLEL
jgi:hypothetical protein